MTDDIMARPDGTGGDDVASLKAGEYIKRGLATASGLIAGYVAQVPRSIRYNTDQDRDVAYQAIREARLLVDILRPFAEAADDLDEADKDGSHIWESAAAMNITAGNLRAARDALLTRTSTPAS